MSVDPRHLRMAEALLFAAAEPLDRATLEQRLPDGIDLAALMTELGAFYQGRGVELRCLAGRWAFCTAPDLAFLMTAERQVRRRLSRVCDLPSSWTGPPCARATFSVHAFTISMETNSRPV